MPQVHDMTITPDLQTRESVMAAAGRAQFSVTSADGVRYVKIEAKIKLDEGGYVKGTQPLDEATHVFVSEKGYGTPRIGTYYPPKGKFTNGRFFPADNADPSFVWALEQVVSFVNDGTTDAEVTQIEVESRCGLCGHKLEDPKSIARGIGPECAGKPTGSKILHSSIFGGQIKLDAPLPEGYEPIQHEQAEAFVAASVPGIPQTQTRACAAAEVDFSDAQLMRLRDMADYWVREAVMDEPLGVDAEIVAKLASYFAGNKAAV